MLPIILNPKYNELFISTDGSYTQNLSNSDYTISMKQGINLVRGSHKPFTFPPNRYSYYAEIYSILLIFEELSWFLQKHPWKTEVITYYIDNEDFIYQFQQFTSKNYIPPFMKGYIMYKLIQNIKKSQEPHNFQVKK